MRMLFSTVRRLRSRMKREAPESSPCWSEPASRGLMARDSKARRSPPPPATPLNVSSSCSSPGDSCSLLATALNESLSAPAYVVDYRAHQKKKDEFQDKQSFWAVIPQRFRPPAL